MSAHEQIDIGPGKFSRWMPVVGLLVMGAVGLERYLEDASFWVDESIVAESLRDMTLEEIFGPLGPGRNSFPRLYMAALLGFKNLFGYETVVLRALPFAFYLAATYLWLKLLSSRLRAFPALIVLALFLCLLPTSWFAYASMLKQYTFDVFLSILLFVIPDRFFDRALRHGKSPWLCLAFALPCALSYTYAISLAGRVAGWYAGGMAQRNYRLAPLGLAALVAGVAISSLSLWLTDIRFMANSVYGWWASCSVGHNWSATHLLLDKFAIGWYSGQQEFPIDGGLPEALKILLRVALLLGVLQVIRSLFGRPLRHLPGDWGSRSLGALFVVAATLGASLFMQYPVCSGRLTLFVLLPLQLLLFEGFVAFHAWLEDDRNLRGLSLSLGVLWVVSIAPFGVRDAYRFSETHAPDDLRPMLGRIRSQDELPVHVMPCMWGVVQALPEGLPTPETVYVASAHQTPWAQEILILEKNPHPGISYCFDTHKIFEKRATDWQVLHTNSDPVRLFRARFPDEPPERLRPPEESSPTPEQGLPAGESP